MREIQPKKKPKLRIRPLLLMLVLVVAVIFLAKASWGVLQKERESRANAEEVQKELDALLERKALLQGETDKLSTEEGLEEAIREKFQVSKNGESVMVVVEKPQEGPIIVERKGFFANMWSGITSLFGKD